MLRVHADRHMACLKTLLQSLPSDPSLLPYPEFIGLIVPIPEFPWQNLDPAPLSFGERCGVFLHDTEADPPFVAVEVVPQAVPGPRGPRSAGKG